MKNYTKHFAFLLLTTLCFAPLQAAGELKIYKYSGTEKRKKKFGFGKKTNQRVFKNTNNNKNNKDELTHKKGKKKMQNTIMRCLS